MYLTKPQRRALRRIYERNPDGARSYREFRRRAAPMFDCAAVAWRGMVIGIETDGYTHS